MDCTWLFDWRRLSENDLKVVFTPLSHLGDDAPLLLFSFEMTQRLVKKRIDLSAKMRKSSFWQSFLEKTNNSLANLGLFSVDRLGNTSARFQLDIFVIWTGFCHCLINLGLFIVLNFK